ncbi:MAG: glycosyltransferase, partial [Chloroflexi bacterium]|nr:glycosyltransferase [Chloroflexota bacterium]
MNILYITPYVPSLIRTRPYNLIQALVQLGHRITLLTVSGSPTEEQPQVEALRDTGVYVEVFPLTVTRSLINCLQAVPTDDPLQAVYASHPAMARRISELLREGEFDVMHIEHLRAAKLVSAVRPSCRQRLPIIYDSVDSISLLFEQAAHSGAQWRSRIMAAIDLNRTRRYEAQLMTQYDHVVITSRRDREALEQLARQYLPPDAHTAPVTVITNGVDLDYFRPQERDDSSDHPTVIFTGKMSYHANITAALRFAREV